MQKIQQILLLAASAGLGFVATSGAAVAANSHMKVIGGTSQPIGHYEYCRKYSSDCRIRSRNTRPVKLTRKRWDELDKVNLFANSNVRPVTDMDYYRVEEYWTYPDKYGDCEDYVLLKRHMLMQKGWPASSLLVTVVLQPNGDGHAVLTVRTNHADYVLDNLTNKIKPWNKTEYHFLKRQSKKHSGRWAKIDDNRQQIVGSVKR